jgi:nitrogen fixation protein NifZ
MSMMESISSRYEWGQRVQAAADLFNDGSHPEHPCDALLVQCGESGEVVRVGQHTESGTVVYMVQFPLNKVVGCVEQELTPWQANEGAQ